MTFTAGQIWAVIIAIFGLILTVINIIDTVVDQSTDYVMFVYLNGVQLSNYGYASLLPYPDSERLTFVRMTTAAGDLDMDVSNVDLRPMNENVVPTTDGTYKMKVEHVDGELRYSWVAE